jgi:hypothetical protein
MYASLYMHIYIHIYIHHYVCTYTLYMHVHHGTGEGVHVCSVAMIAMYKIM